METKRISLKNHPFITEKHIQNIIADNPKIIGLGNLTLLNKEMKQEDGKKPDLLFKGENSDNIYEVEIQLGKLDETHSWRAIRYWNTERKKSPHYEHCAVVIAEVIDKGILDLIKLYNGNVSIIIVQMIAQKTENGILLEFNGEYESKCNITDKDNNIKIGAIKHEYPLYKELDRQSLENKISGTELIVVNKIHSFLKEIDSNIKINYTQGYVGFKKEYDDYEFIKVENKRIKVVRESDSFVFIQIKPDVILLKLVLMKSSETEAKIKELGLNLIDYGKKRGEYIIKITEDDIKNQRALKEALKLTYKYNINN